jgi:hypothetical protein
MIQDDLHCLANSYTSFTLQRPSWRPRRPGHKRGFIIEHKEIVQDGELKDKLTVKIHCATKLLPNGRIDIEVSGECRKGFESDRTTININNLVKDLISISFIRRMSYFK